MTLRTPNRLALQLKNPNQKPSSKQPYNRIVDENIIKLSALTNFAGKSSLSILTEARVQTSLADLFYARLGPSRG